MSQSSIATTIQNLRTRFPNTAFLALGQTALWDEPVKAAWRALLDRHWPEAPMIAGVHDTDYFAKSTAHVTGDERYVLLPHNDGATRELWSAAGELSCFLGSEDVPTRAMYERHSVPFNPLAKAQPGGKQRFYAKHTEAWGWRAIVHTAANPPIAHDVPLSEIGPALLAQLDWGFSQSLDQIAESHRDAARSQVEEVRGWVADSIDGCREDTSLADLYRELLPKFYRKLLGAEPGAMEFTQTFDLLRFNSGTCILPRFAFVQNFLDPSIRDAACNAYNSAVAGGGMYGLDSFGEGALPFDIAAAGRGRGTLHVTDTSVTVDFRDNPLTIPCKSRPINLEQLAGILESTLGDRIALVGKAVSLISMLAGEFIMLFHETASGYTPRTAAMNEKLLAAGGKVDVHPIVRIAYPTWDALATADIDTPINLPPHFARSFATAGKPIQARQLGAQWRAVVAAQRQRLAALADARSLRGALALLEDPNDDACWPCAREQYDGALTDLRDNATATETIKQAIANTRREVKLRTAERMRLEAAKGDHFRKSIAPLMAQLAAETDKAALSTLSDRLEAEQSLRLTRYENTIEEIRDANQSARRQVKQLRAEKSAIEKSARATDLRARIDDLTAQVQLARLGRVHDAFLTAQSLPHTNARPSAWWLPLIDPSGAWFRAIVDGAQARLEPLD